MIKANDSRNLLLVGAHNNFANISHGPDLVDKCPHRWRWTVFLEYELNAEETRVEL